MEQNIKVAFYFSIIYLILISFIYAFYSDVVSGYNRSLDSTQNRINGLKYLELLHSVGDVAANQQCILALNQKNDEQSTKAMKVIIQNIRVHAKEHLKYKNSILEKHLIDLEELNMEYYEYYNLLDYLNHENYKVGNNSEILFFEDKERYFLGTLTTHYLPEFFISLNISHNILEELVHKKHISDKKKKIFIEHTKLIYLSSEELIGIIRLMDKHKENEKLRSTMDKIYQVLVKLKVKKDDIFSLNINNKSAHSYLEATHELLKLGNILSDENINLLKNLLHNDKSRLTKKIASYEFFLVIAILFITVAFIYFFRILKVNLNSNEALQNQKELYELVFKNTASGVFIIDIETKKFIDCNEQAVSFLKCDSKSNVMKLTMAELSPKYQADRKYSDKKLDEMYAIAIDKGSNSFEWQYLTSTREKIWVEVILTKITLNNREVLHAIWMDISDKKETQKQLMIKSRMAQMGEMISMIAHQWRQPLNAISLTTVNIKLNLEFKKFDLTSQDGVNKCYDDLSKGLGNIEGYVKSLSETIDDFRNFYEKDKKLVTTTLEKIIVKALEIVKPLMEISNIEIVEMYDSCEELELHDGEIMQVILNILKNSQDNFDEKGIKNPKITITARNKIMSICDNGGGIPESVIESIYDPYFSTKDEKNGTGLGLYMSKVIVQDHHNGTLTAKNIGDGICFSVDLGQVD